MCVYTSLDVYKERNMIHGACKAGDIRWKGYNAQKKKMLSGILQNKKKKNEREKLQ